MSAPLPDALRARFQRYVEEGLSGRAAAFRSRLSPATGARQVHRTGRIDPAPQGRPKGRGKLDPHPGSFLRSSVRMQTSQCQRACEECGARQFAERKKGP